MQKYEAFSHIFHTTWWSFKKYNKLKIYSTNIQKHAFFLKITTNCLQKYSITYVVLFSIKFIQVSFIGKISSSKFY